ncbi:MAG TPA: DUF4118 domain-containing protein, partial [Aggregatilineales bacterium]|nr:DUF4118 domain-containing protein [Aggregatilineales bacterium]
MTPTPPSKLDMLLANIRAEEIRPPRPLWTIRPTTPPIAYGKALIVVGACTALAFLMFPHFAPANLIMVYLVGVVVVAYYYGRGPAILASFVSVATFDFFFVEPALTFAVSDTQYFLTFGVMLLVAVTISTLTVRLKRQAETAREREERIASLYAISRELASAQGLDGLIRAAEKHIGDVFDCKVIIALPTPAGQIQPQNDPRFHPDAANWAYKNGQASGLGTETFPSAQGLYLPLITAHGVFGVMDIYPRQSQRFFSQEQLNLLGAFTHQTALALERTRLAEEAERTRLQIETERMRNALLSSVSHDLRTPLASIEGATSTLLENGDALAPVDRRELLQIAYEEAERLNRLVGNLLYMTRLEAGNVRVNKRWGSLEELVGVTLSRLEPQLHDRPVTVAIPNDMPLIPFDSLLIEQVLVNLLENAFKYTP